ncbi:hypothetical protein J8J14_00880 [Roseomonas sp. SSH11]|uniref:PepSY domain-containing protein n=1 Tax=Pararoseomonas baculiformis TaxID=2820812 RepID=A0ABS4A9W8_9PROT|nr:hypothetical protein [Pararoseomonas baculiformis]MBP0443318.1 hypothetical protein [Pararoseomonas baculiformis]
MKTLASTTALASILALGLSGAGLAQNTNSGMNSGMNSGANAGQTGNASGGVLAQAGQSGSAHSGMGQQANTSGQGGTAQGGMNQQNGTAGRSQAQTGQHGSTASTMGQQGHAASTAAQGAGTQANQGQQAGRMGEGQVRSALNARGYSDISGLKREGDTFRVSSAKRYGEEVKDLRVDARTGQVRDEQRLNEDQARNLIRANGYENVRDVRRDGDTIRAKAKQGDREVDLRVDARNATVTRQQASN